MFGISALTSVAFIALFILIGTAIAFSMNNTEIKKSDEKYRDNSALR